MPNRYFSSAAYRYGFNGMEKDDEMKGSTGTSFTTYFRQYDPRLGRFHSMDPVNYPWQSDYAAFNNNPIFFADPSGAEGENTNGGKAKHEKGKKDGKGTKYSKDKNKRSAGETSQTFNEDCKCYLNDDIAEGAQTASSEPQQKTKPADVKDDIVPRFTPEARESDYGGTFDQYKDEYNLDGNYEDILTDWEANHRNNYYDNWDAEAKKERDREVVAKMYWFAQGFETISTVVGPVTGINSFNSSASPKTFSFTPRGTGYKNIYRSVSLDEALSIHRTGGFSFKPGQMEVKQFWTSEKALNNFNNTGWGGGFNVRVTVPKSILGSGRAINTKWQPDFHLGQAGTVENAVNLRLLNTASFNIKIY